LPTKRHKRT